MPESFDRKPHGDRPWILELGQAQQQRPATVEQVYDEARQMTHLQESAYRAAIDADEPTMTKKADLETGEDQKGR